MTLTSRRATFAGRTGWVWFRLRKRQVEEAKCLCGRAMERGRNGRVWKCGGCGFNWTPRIRQTQQVAVSPT